MEIIFSPNAIEDIQYLKKTNNQVILKRIRLLIDNIQKSPFSGLGKPEPLKIDLKGTWSRRITIKHRLTYEVSTNGINILSVMDIMINLITTIKNINDKKTYSNRPW